MASIRKEIALVADAESVWAAIRDFGAVHKKVAPGFVVDARLEGDTRVVTFANGLVAREVLVDSDDKARRLVYAVVGGRATHYNASVQVIAESGDKSRLIWTIDLLPNELAAPIGAMVEHAVSVMKPTLDRAKA